MGTTGLKRLGHRPGRGQPPQIAIAPDGTVTAVWYRSDGDNNIIPSASTGKPSILLQVEREGSGAGTVTSSPAGISCGADCSEAYTDATVVTLTATPRPGSTFSGWSGAGCSGTGTCQVTLTSDQTATATFTAIPRARINRVSVSGPARIRRGRAATYRVRVTNSGNAQATGVRLIVSGRGFRFNAPIRVINPGVTRTVNVRVRPRIAGRVRVTFKATSSNAGSKTAIRTITVRK